MDNQAVYDLKEYMNIVKKGKWIIILTTLLATCLSIAINFYYTKPSYISSTSVVLGRTGTGENGRLQYDDTYIYEEHMKTYVEIAKSDAVARGVSEKLNKKSTSEMIKKYYEISSDIKSQIIVIKAEGETPQEALSMAKAISDSFEKEAKRIYSFTTVNIVDEPQLPKYATDRNRILKTALGIFVALIGSIAIVFIRDYFDLTIKTEKDIEKYLNLPVMGSISKYKVYKKNKKRNNWSVNNGLITSNEFK